MIIVDIEASGLDSESYPIEVAWQDATNDRRWDSFLICPPEHWQFWDDYAELQIHHISRELLQKEGVSPKEACRRLNVALQGRTVYSDALSYDQMWLFTLYHEINERPAFFIQSLFSLLSVEKQCEYEDWLSRTTVVHRALADVRQIINWLEHS